MSFTFQELDSQETPLGPISLRKRAEPQLDNRVLYEVKLGDEFLMSSLFPEAEIQLSRQGIDMLVQNGFRTDLNIVVGGLGLGYTAAAVLDAAAVKSLIVVELMDAVIDWHQRYLVPLGERLCGDSRCTLLQGDFFAMATDRTRTFDDERVPLHGIFLDIDHSPDNWLDSENSSFYSEQSLSAMKAKLVDGGVFGLWSNDLPDAEFTRLLEAVFARVETRVIPFHNPYSGGESTNSLYLCC